MYTCITINSLYVLDEEELERNIKRKEAKSRAIVLEMMGDIPDADAKPPDEVLFVCKLNPVTTDEDLELIFSRFGPIKSCEIIRDHKTGDSLNYGFVHFETEKACVQAYEKMNNVLIDDRRIKVDFSQSVSKLWNRYLMQSKQTKNKIIINKNDGGKSHYGPSSNGFGGNIEVKIKKEFKYVDGRDLSPNRIRKVPIDSSHPDRSRSVSRCRLRSTSAKRDRISRNDSHSDWKNDRSDHRDDRHTSRPRGRDVEPSRPLSRVRRREDDYDDSDRRDKKNKY